MQSQIWRWLNGMKHKPLLKSRLSSAQNLLWTLHYWYIVLITVNTPLLEFE